MENKIKIIDDICTYHPSLGVDVGWSEYTGGMMDTGRWYFRKMLDVSERELQNFLDSLIERQHQIDIAPESDLSFEEASRQMFMALEKKAWYGK